MLDLESTTIPVGLMFLSGQSEIVFLLNFRKFLETELGDEWFINPIPNDQF